jgi:small subunit ribosomal protein S20
MANHVSALKRVRVTERRTAVNRARKSRLRTGVRAMRRLLAANDVKAAQEALPATFSIIDRAAKWGVIKKNTASRYKSRIVKHIGKLAAA